MRNSLCLLWAWCQTFRENAVNKLVPCAWLLSGALEVWSLRNAGIKPVLSNLSDTAGHPRNYSWRLEAVGAQVKLKSSVQNLLNAINCIVVSELYTFKTFNKFRALWLYQWFCYLLNFLSLIAKYFGNSGGPLKFNLRAVGWITLQSIITRNSIKLHLIWFYLILSCHNSLFVLHA